MSEGRLAFFNKMGKNSAAYHSSLIVRHFLPAFTLIELMLVMAIMGLLGTVSIGGFRAMRRGMEQDKVIDIRNQFMENAYQRAKIDRVPVAVYFWNETREDEKTGSKLVVVGHAVAVRRSGRITKVEGSYLIDEFGDLRFSAATDDEGEVDGVTEDEIKNGIKAYLYKINGNESSGLDNNRSEVSQATAYQGRDISHMLTDATWKQDHSDEEISAYGWYTEDASKWKEGDAYGFEFDEITLPNNYIFGSSYSDDAKNPIQEAGGTNPVNITPDDSSVSVPSIYAIRPGEDGAPKAVVVKDN